MRVFNAIQAVLLYAFWPFGISLLREILFSKGWHDINVSTLSFLAWMIYGVGTWAIVACVYIASNELEKK